MTANRSTTWRAVLACGTVVEPRTYYPSTLDSTASVPGLVTAGAGAG